MARETKALSRQTCCPTVLAAPGVWAGPGCVLALAASWPHLFKGFVQRPCAAELPPPRRPVSAQEGVEMIQRLVGIRRHSWA